MHNSHAAHGINSHEAGEAGTNKGNSKVSIEINTKTLI